MINVAIIVPSLTGGGAERVAGYLAKYLSKYYKIYIFIKRKEDVSYEYGGKLVELSEACDYSCTMEHALIHLKQKYKIDVSISFMEKSNFANIFSRCNDKIIISERTNFSQFCPRHRITDKLIRENYRYADAIVACSYGIKQSLHMEYKIQEDKTSVIYNFIDKEKINKMSNEEWDRGIDEFVDGSEYFINVGRLELAKRQKQLIEQYKIFHENDSCDIKLVIIGAGELRTNLEDTIEKLGLGEYIKIFSYSSNPFKYIAKAKAFLLTSDREGMPNVLLETMVLGVPIVSVDCFSGPRELLMGETDYFKSLSDIQICKRGILTKRNLGDTDNFARALHWICENQEKCKEISKNQISYMNQYSNEEILCKWRALIEADFPKAKVSFPKRDKNVFAKYIYIYGAGKIGRVVFEDYSRKYSITAFVCTDTNNMPKTISGIPVISINEVKTKNEETSFIIGVSETYWDDVCEFIKDAGYTNYFIPF